MWSGALDSSSVLQSYSIASLASPMTNILISTLIHTYIHISTSAEEVVSFPRNKKEFEQIVNGAGSKNGLVSKKIDGASVPRNISAEDSYSHQPKDVTLYSVPYSKCGSLFTGRSGSTDSILETVSICVSPPVDGAGIRSIEGRMELLLLPTQSSDRSAKLISKFHNEVSRDVQMHVDTSLEEIADSHAMALKNAESEIRSRETHLKSLRDDVEKERKQQEVILRDMKQNAIPTESETSSKTTSSRKR